MKDGGRKRRDGLMNGSMEVGEGGMEEVKGYE